MAKRCRMSFMALVLLGVALAAGEPGPGSVPRLVRYDASREVTLSCVVSAVEVSTRAEGSFVTLSCVAGRETYVIPLGSEAQLKKNQVTFAKGDAVTIVGVPGPGGTGLVVGKIIKGDAVVTLLAGR